MTSLPPPQLLGHRHTAGVSILIGEGGQKWVERPKGDLREVRDLALNCHASSRSEASQAEALGACLGVDRPHCTSFQASVKICTHL